MRQRLLALREKVGLVMVLLGVTCLAAPNLALAQDGTREAPYPVGVVAEAGDDWVVSVVSVSLDPPRPSGQASEGRLLVRATLQVQNMSSQPRYFPGYYVRLVNSSGVPQRDTWCGRLANPVEIIGNVPTGAIRTADICWVYDPADASGTAIYIDRERQPVFFALTPTISDAVQTVPPSAAISTTPASSLASAPPSVPTGTDRGHCRAEAYPFSCLPDGSPSDLGRGVANDEPGLVGSATNAGSMAPRTSSTTAPHARAEANSTQLYPSAAQPRTSSAVPGTSGSIAPSTGVRTSPSQFYPSAAQPATSSTVTAPAPASRGR